MTPEQIKRRLKEMRLSQSELARMWDESDVVIHLLVNRKLTSERLETKLAKKLGITLEELRKPPASSRAEEILKLLIEYGRDEGILKQKNAEGMTKTG